MYTFYATRYILLNCEVKKTKNINGMSEHNKLSLFYYHLSK